MTQSVGTIGTSTTLASTPNPSFAGQAVTFTATVSKSGGAGTPTGTVTFKDGGTTLGTGTLNGAGAASFATSALAAGSHSVTAVYGGDANFGVSTSAAISQTVNLPADSIKLRALQIQATKLEAQGSGQAIAGTIDGAISEGFAQAGAPISANDNGVHFNFSADPQPQEKEKTFAERTGGAFAALGYGSDPVVKTPPRPAPREWLFWADVRGTDWSTKQETGDIRGGQTNGFLGLTHKLSPDFLVGAFGGMEIFNYTSQLLDGHLKGNGWTAGGYLGWRLFPGLHLDLGGSHSGIDYDGLAGMASGTFPGQRWLATAALVGTIKTMPGFEIEKLATGLWAMGARERLYGQPGHGTGRAKLFDRPRQRRNQVLVSLDDIGRHDGRPLCGRLCGLLLQQGRRRASLRRAAPASHHVHSRLVGARDFGHRIQDRGRSPVLDRRRAGGLGSSQFTNWSVRGRASLPF